MKNLFIILIAGICLVAAPPARAAALFATQSPAAAASVGPSGTGWSASTLADALLVDGAEAKLTSAMPLSSASKLLVLTGFNFAIPAGATITGVAVSVTRRSTSSSGEFIKDAVVELVGAFGTSTSLATADAWPATLAAATYGGVSELWGASPTPADINSASFGVAIAAQNTDPDVAHNAHVDGATVTVYYTVLTGQAITVSTSSPASAAYGSTFDVAASAGSGLPVAIAASGACSGTGSDTATITMASSTGDCTISYTQAGDADYAPAAGVAEIVAAQKAPLTVTADAKSKTSGDADPALTYAHGALAGTDTEAVFSGALARAAGEEAGAYAIGQGTLTAGDNYDIAFTGAEFVINAVEPPQQAGNVGTGNGAPVGTYGASPQQDGNIRQRDGEVLGVETEASPGGTPAQRKSNLGTGTIKALLNFLQAFGVDQSLIDLLSTALHTP